MSDTYETLPLLRKGWGRRKMSEEQVRLATPLVAKGIEFRGFPTPDVNTAQVAAFNAAHIAGPTTGGNLQGVAALDPEGDVIGAVTLEPALVTMPHDPADQLLLAHIRYVAVAPQWRRQGIATVLLCIMDQQGIPETVTRRLFLGGCAPTEARFYQRAGFDVLQPGAVIPPELLGAEEGFVNTNADYPCWFLRTWSPQHA